MRAQVRGELDGMGIGHETLRLGPSAGAHVDAYLEYHRIVGDDGGPLLSGACPIRPPAASDVNVAQLSTQIARIACTAAEDASQPALTLDTAFACRDTPLRYAQPSKLSVLNVYRSPLPPTPHSHPDTEADYAAFKARAVSVRADRLYVTWRNANGLDCKNVGPATACFCGHRFRQHATDNMGGKQRHAKDVRCTEPGCGCGLFDFLPAHGTWAVKCACKHDAADHDPRSKRCRSAAKCGCAGFHSAFSCSCGLPWASHHTAVETRSEREAAGRPVDNLAGGGAGYEALGAVTSFAALADGYERAALGYPSLPFSEAVGRMRLEDPGAAEAAMAAADGRRAPLAGPPPGKCALLSPPFLSSLHHTPFFRNRRAMGCASALSWSQAEAAGVFV